MIYQVVDKETGAIIRSFANRFAAYDLADNLGEDVTINEVEGEVK